ncbi:MAG: prefoldin subunit alpha [Methanomassiliicoccales archaeon]
MNEEELRQSMSTLEYYRAQLESMEERERVLQMTYEENKRARQTIKNIGESSEGDELLVPIGGDSFAFARVAANDKVLVGLGSGVTAEKSVEDALSTLDSRMEELSQNLQEVQGKRQEVQQTYQELSQQVQQAYQQLQQGQQG